MALEDQAKMWLVLPKHHRTRVQKSRWKQTDNNSVTYTVFKTFLLKEVTETYFPQKLLKSLKN